MKNYKCKFVLKTAPYPSCRRTFCNNPGTHIIEFSVPSFEYVIEYEKIILCSEHKKTFPHFEYQTLIKCNKIKKRDRS